MLVTVCTSFLLITRTLYNLLAITVDRLKLPDFGFDFLNVSDQVNLLISLDRTDHISSNASLISGRLCQLDGEKHVHYIRLRAAHLGAHTGVCHHLRLSHPKRQRRLKSGRIPQPEHQLRSRVTAQELLPPVPLPVAQERRVGWRGEGRAVRPVNGLEQYELLQHDQQLQERLLGQSRD